MARCNDRPRALCFGIGPLGTTPIAIGPVGVFSSGEVKAMGSFWGPSAQHPSPAFMPHP